MLGVVPSSALSWPGRSRSIINPLKWTRRRKKEDIIFRGLGGAHQKETSVGMSGGVTYIDSRWSLQRTQMFWGSSWWRYPGCSCLNPPHCGSIKTFSFSFSFRFQGSGNFNRNSQGDCLPLCARLKCDFPCCMYKKTSSHVKVFVWSCQTWQLLKHPAGDSDTWPLRKQYIFQHSEEQLLKYVNMHAQFCKSEVKCRRERSPFFSAECWSAASRVRFCPLWCDLTSSQGRTLVTPESSQVDKHNTTQLLPSPQRHS